MSASDGDGPLSRTMADTNGPARHCRLEDGRREEGAGPVRITVVAALGGHPHDPDSVDDRRGEHGRAGQARLAPQGVQLGNGYREGRAQLPAAGQVNDGPVEL